MLSLRKRDSNVEQRTFKARVEQFWHWFAQVANRFYQMLEEQRLADVVAESTAIVDDLFPGFAWVYGSGHAGVQRSFTLSGDSVLQRQLLTIYWASRAPALDGWAFYPSRQPSPLELIDVMRMNFEGEDLKPLEFWVVPTIDDEEERVDLTVWHPLYAGVPEEEARLGAFFVFLDEVLGEYGTSQRIGNVTASDEQLAEAMPVAELRGLIQRLEAEKGWQNFAPGEAGHAYTREQGSRFLRDDILTGSTTLFDLIMDYEDAKGEMEDPLAGTGADYVFVSMDRRLFPDGKEIETRDVIEDALRSALESEHSGRILGGAFGTQSAYLDLMVFDGKNSVQIIERVLREQKLPAGTAINFFAREKISQRAVLS